MTRINKALLGVLLATVAQRKPAPKTTGKCPTAHILGEFPSLGCTDKHRKSKGDRKRNKRDRWST